MSAEHPENDIKESKERQKKLSPPTARSINSLTPYRVKIQNYAQMVCDLHPHIKNPDHSSSCFRQHTQHIEEGTSLSVYYSI